MTLNKNDLVMLGGRTLAWAAENGCVKNKEEDHSYFTYSEWHSQFGHSNPIFQRTKDTMVELGMSIAHRSSHGHYVSDVPSDVALSMIVGVKHIITRLETFSATAHSAQKSKHSVEVMERLQEAVSQLDLQINDNGKLTFQSQVSLLVEESV